MSVLFLEPNGSSASEFWGQYLAQFSVENDGEIYSPSNLSRFIISARLVGVRIGPEDVREILNASCQCSGMEPSNANLFEDGLLSEVDAINATLDVLESDFGISAKVLRSYSRGTKP